MKHNRKARFQIAVQRVPMGAPPSSGLRTTAMAAALKRWRPEVDPTRSYHFAIRACAGHSYPHIDTDRICAAVTVDCVEYLSALCHVNAV